MRLATYPPEEESPTRPNTGRLVSLISANRPKEAEPLLKEIIKNSPLDYYAAEASSLLKTLGVTYTPEKKTEQFPDITLTPGQSTDKLVMAATKLMDKGLYEFALINLDALPKATKTSPAIAFLSAKAAYHAGRYFQAQEMLAAAFAAWWRIHRKTPLPSSWKLPFRGSISPKLPRSRRSTPWTPNLVWAVVRQESRYDASAVSPAGALGLMQVTPEAACFCEKGRQNTSSRHSEIMEPTQNIAHGIRILSKNMTTFKGKVIPAVAAYNADVKKVKDWLKRNEKMKQDEFVESIPYLENAPLREKSPCRLPRI